jgi:hypothetical protein
MPNFVAITTSLRRAPSASAAVGVGGVKEVDTGLEGSVDNDQRADLVEAAAEVVATDSDLRDRERSE